MAELLDDVARALRGVLTAEDEEADYRRLGEKVAKHAPPGEFTTLPFAAVPRSCPTPDRAAR